MDIVHLPSVCGSLMHPPQHQIVSTTLTYCCCYCCYLWQMKASSHAHLQELPVVQILPDILHNPGSCLEDVAHMVVVDNAIKIPLPVSGFLQAEQSHALTLSSASSCCKRLLAGKLLASAPVSVSQSVESIVMCLFLKTWHAVMASCFWMAMPVEGKLNETSLHSRIVITAPCPICCSPTSLHGRSAAKACGTPSSRNRCPAGPGRWVVTAPGATVKEHYMVQG